jgi:hypothetical protein
VSDVPTTPVEEEEPLDPAEFGDDGEDLDED